jgi:hypothetical protein
MARFFSVTEELIFRNQGFSTTASSVLAQECKTRLSIADKCAHQHRLACNTQEGRVPAILEAERMNDLSHHESDHREGNNAIASPVLPRISIKRHVCTQRTVQVAAAAVVSMQPRRHACARGLLQAAPCTTLSQADQAVAPCPHQQPPALTQPA